MSILCRIKTHSGITCTTLTLIQRRKISITFGLRLSLGCIPLYYPYLPKSLQRIMFGMHYTNNTYIWRRSSHKIWKSCTAALLTLLRPRVVDWRRRLFTGLCVGASKRIFEPISNFSVAKHHINSFTTASPFLT